MKRHKALAVRVAELTEDLEELRSEKSLLLQKFEYAEDAGELTIHKYRTGSKHLCRHQRESSLRHPKSCQQFFNRKGLCQIIVRSGIQCMNLSLSSLRALITMIGTLDQERTV